MYYLIFLIGVFFIFFPKHHKIFASIFTIFLLVLAIGRYGVGTDFFAYKFLYNSYNKSVLYEIFYSTGREEILYRVLSTIGNNLGISYICSLAFYSVISLVSISIAAKKFSKNALISMLTFYSFFYFVWIFSGIRQGIVISISIILILYCFDKERNKTLIIFTIILSMVHLSGLIIVFLYYIAKSKWSKKSLIYLFIISFIIGIIPLNFLSNFNILSDRVSAYSSENNILKIDFQSIIRLLLIIIVFAFYNKIKNINSIHNFILKYYIIGICVYFLLKDVELVAARLSIYSRVLEIFIIPGILSVINKKYIYISILTIVILLFAYFNKELINMGRNIIPIDGNRSYVQYTNIFNKDNFYFLKEYEFKTY